ncbi:hypothetical protein NEF87_004537 [Candidatus Lokiarchaeum ossiferum]|uniref:Uncharacterized protein n=1 Tax=Candidatus Lokiarchaeum ossiferum TaxID=2951803 RepID=A0ABY6HZE5_9ARCH|nr:hypothetical protein NEF87_004537 [Candidatus Lokiarchaeum sp. B-35]
MEDQCCEVCCGTGFAKVQDSILLSHYSFITKENLYSCKKCGAKYTSCKKCGYILNRVHISLDIFDLKVICPSCETKDNELILWIQKNSEKKP